MNSEFDFPVRVLVFLDGELIKTKMGVSNEWTRNAKVYLSDDD